MCRHTSEFKTTAWSCHKLFTQVRVLHINVWKNSDASASYRKSRTPIVISPEPQIQNNITKNHYMHICLVFTVYTFNYAVKEICINEYNYVVVSGLFAQPRIKCCIFLRYMYRLYIVGGAVINICMITQHLRSLKHTGPQFLLFYRRHIQIPFLEQNSDMLIQSSLKFVRDIQYRISNHWFRSVPGAEYETRQYLSHW